MHRWRRNFCLPHYTPWDWWECDLFELTDAGYYREYEIKVTRADFFNDKDKEQFCHADLLDARKVEKKHDLLAAHSARGPVQFWYVTPAGLVKLNEVPDWAGLIEIFSKLPESRHFYEEEKIKAPRLHRAKCNPKTVDHARGVCYYRMHSLMADAVTGPVTISVAH
jgi:hypothetical protein